MSDAWERAKKLADKHANQGSIFVRLANDGDKVVGAFCGEPHAREVVWNGERYEPYDPDSNGDKRPSLRVSFNFFVPAENAMKVIEGGVTWFRDVTKVRDKYGLDTWLFEIERHGAAGNAKTTYSLLPDERISEELRARIAAVELHDLERLVSGEGDQENDAPATPAKTSTPTVTAIDPKTAGEIVARLKALPRADVDAFLGKLGVKRVKELKASDETRARALLDQLEAKARAAAEQTEVDPFA